MWKAAVGLFLSGGILFLFLAGLLAVTKGTFDVHVHDRYMIVLPRYLLLVSVILLIATFAVWKTRVSR